MNDERIDALVRRLDGPAQPDPAFATRSFESLLPSVQRARHADARLFARLSRALRLQFGIPVSSERGRSLLVLLALLALLLAVALAIALIGSRRPVQPLGTGPLIVAKSDGLWQVAAGTGGAATVVVGEPTKGASRSPDGRLVSYWTLGPDGDQLEIASLDGADRRTVSGGMRLTWNGCIDTWALDSGRVAASVMADGVARILVADVATGSARLLTPSSVSATCPLWSPDGSLIAFAMKTQGPQTLGVIHLDGTEVRDIGGGLDGASVSGPDSWSPDGTWIYFDAGLNGRPHRLYRAAVARGVSEALTPPALGAVGPALSPDGSMITFNVPNGGPFDVYVAAADGTHIRLLQSQAFNDGWSSDGSLILVDWRPSVGPGGLATIRPDGSGRQIVFPTSGCTQVGSSQPNSCVVSVGWGQPRP